MWNTNNARGHFLSGAKEDACFFITIFYKIEIKMEAA